MDWKSVNWAQVCAIVLLVAVLMVLGGWLLITRIAVMHERAKDALRQQHQAFLRGEYARLASEHQIAQTDLRNLITEVHGMALALKDAIASESWDPEAHLETLSALDADMARLHLTPSAPPDLA